MNKDPTTPAFSEAELHGLVDGHLEPTRQADVIRRMKSHPMERVKIETWREQNDLIRATFSDVANEAIPVSLNLAPPPRLRCVASDGRATIVQAPAVNRPPTALRDDTRRRKRRSIALVGVVGCFGLISAWLMWTNPRPVDAPVSVARTGPLTESLAGRTIEALAQSRLETSGKPPRRARTLPTVSIPDLGAQGFSFSGATIQPAESTILIFLYDNEAGERIAIGVAHATASPAPSASSTADSRHIVSWRRRDRSYVLTGALDEARLNAIATAFQITQDAGADAD